jgi:preprotein translocase subunit SecE
LLDPERSRWARRDEPASRADEAPLTRVEREFPSMFTRMIANIKEFLSDVRNELKKVSFPTKAETMGSTTVVIVFCVLMSIYLSVIDSFLSWLVGKIL